QAARSGGIEQVKFPIRLGDDGLIGFFLDHNYQQFYPASGLERRTDGYNRYGFMPEISLEEALDLTLLMDPRRGIGVTSGILPRTTFHLPSGDMTETLDNTQV